jgi:hypothetical protein
MRLGICGLPLSLFICVQIFHCKKFSCEYLRMTKRVVCGGGGWSVIRAAKLGVRLEWLSEGGGVKTVTGPIPAIKTDELRHRPVWFNSIVAAYTGWKDSRNDPEKAVTFGDGTPLPKDAVLACLQVLEEEKVSIPWRHGDVLMLDNNAVQHSRKAFVPPRRVLASLAK